MRHVVLLIALASTVPAAAPPAPPEVMGLSAARDRAEALKGKRVVVVGKVTGWGQADGHRMIGLTGAGKAAAAIAIPDSEAGRLPPGDLTNASLAFEVTVDGISKSGRLLVSDPKAHALPGTNAEALRDPPEAPPAKAKSPARPGTIVKVIGGKEADYLFRGRTESDPPRVWVPALVKKDGTVVNGHWVTKAKK